MRGVGLVAGVYGSLGLLVFFFFQAEDGIRDVAVTGVQTCALPIFALSVWNSNSIGVYTGAVSAALAQFVGHEVAARFTASRKAPTSAELQRQIGRASCRERV